MSKRYPGGIIRKTPQTPSQTSAQGVWDMASVLQAKKDNTWPIAGVPDPISRSLRFRKSASASLTRTYTATGSTQKFTGSVWVKRGLLGTSQTFFGAQNTSAQTWDYFNFNGSDQIQLFIDPGTTPYNVITSSVFRDPSAWYHVVFAVDTTQATASNRVRIYVNGVEQPLGTNTIPQNYNLRFNVSGNTAGIGTQVNYAATTGPVTLFDGYFAEVYWVDGQQLTPSSFGSTNDQTGVWQPVAYTGTYGTNGFYLPFSNTASTATLGYDFSGNSNNWTTNNISLTSGSTYDSMVDVPTQWIPYNTAGDTGALYRGNYCVLNPLYGTGVTGNFFLDSANLNLNVTNNSGYRNVAATFSPESFKGYLEVTMVTSPNGEFGFAYESIVPSNLQYASAGTFYIEYNSGDVRNGSTVLKSGCTPTFSSGDILQIAFDFTGGGRNVWFGRNGTWGSNSVGVGDPANGTNPVLTVSNIAQASRFYFAINTGGGTVTIAANFGQRPFAYTPPAGFVSLNTTNLPTPTIGATATTQANDYFDATLYTGNGSTQNITNSGSMQPDMVWIKSRSSAYDHNVFDSVRGVYKQLVTNATYAENNYTTSLTAFNSNGFSVGSDIGTNNNGSTFVAWQWRASNAAGVTNTAGSITSTVSANTSAGFSIVTYTGSGSAATVGHGLGVAPRMIIIKDRDNGTYDWNVYHASLSSPTTLKLYLNTTDAETNGGTNSGTWNSTAPTSTVFSLGTFLNVNKSGDKFVAYCFAQVAGYSAFGSYTGNGSTDGPFVFCGFRPRYIVIKRSSGIEDWRVFDTARSTYNIQGATLYPNTSGAENSGQLIDINSNGFKCRTTDAAVNGSGSTYIYMAFAEVPFKYALGR